MVLVLADRGEPWQGLLIPSERSAHASILADHPSLRVHPVLGKWLYLADDTRRFTTMAAAIARAHRMPATNVSASSLRSRGCRGAACSIAA